MKRIGFAWIAGAAALIAAGEGEARPLRSRPDAAQAAVPAARPDLDAILTRGVTEGGPPAMGILVIRDGRIDAVAVRGVRRLGGGAVQTDDRWQLGSDTKAMTAALIARLVDQGRLSWTATLEQMLPGLAAAMRHEYRDVTLVDLLTHRAGLSEPGGAADAYFQSFYADPRPLPEQRLDWVARALTLEPVGEKRGESRYSNTGFLLAAVIAEHTMGAPYEELMLRHVLQPLGMTTATFSPAVDPDDLAGHVDGRIAGAQDANPPMWAPAGGLRMSLRDWARFCIDQMDGAAGHGVLMRAEAYRALHTPYGQAGLGWGVEADFAGRQGPVLQHTGSDGNWYAGVVLFPATRDGMLVVTSAGESMGGDRAAFSALRPVLVTLSRPVPPTAATAAGG